MDPAILSPSDFEEWLKENKTQPKYISSTEARDPQKYYWTLDFAQIHQKLKTLSNIIASGMEGAPHDDVEIQHISKMGRALYTVSRSKTFLVALSGHQAAGKSAFLNALLDCPGLCESGAKGYACTNAIVRYFYYCGNSQNPNEAFLAEVKFLDADRIQEIIQQHAHDYYHFYNWDEEDEDGARTKKSDDHDNENVQAKDTAQDIFQTLFGSNDAFLDAWSVDAYRDGTFQRECYQKCVEVTSKLNTDQNRTTTYFASTAPALTKSIRRYLTKVPGETCLWPFVETIRYGLNREILKAGFEFLDIPGWGDTNIAKARHAEEVRDTVDFEMILVDTARIETDSTANNNIRQALRARGPERVVVVATKIDLFTDSDLADGKGEDFEWIVRQRDDIKSQLEDIENMAMTATDDGDEEQEVENLRRRSRLENYDTYLTRQLLCLKITERKRSIDSDYAVNRFSDVIGNAQQPDQHNDQHKLRMFHTSVPEYMKLTARDFIPFKAQSSLSPELTGVPAIRKYLFNIPADSNLRDLRNHVYTEVNCCLDNIDRVVYTENRSEGFQILAAEIKTKKDAFMVDVASGLKKSFKDASEIINDMTAPEMAVYRQNIDTLIEDYWLKSYTYATFNKIMKQKGYVLKGTSKAPALKEGCNLNQELSLTLDDLLNDWRSRQRRMNETLRETLPKFFNELFDSVMDTIHHSKSDVSAIAMTKRKWAPYQARLLTQVDILLANLKEAQIWLYNRALMKDVSQLGPVAYVTLKLYDEVYTAVAPLKHPSDPKRKQRKVGRYQFQKQTLEHLFIDPNCHILDKIVVVFRGVVEGRIGTVLNEHITNVNQILDEFLQTIQGLAPIEYELTPRGERIRASQRKMLPTLRKYAHDLQSLITPEDIKAENSQSYSSVAGSGGKKDLYTIIEQVSAAKPIIKRKPVQTVLPHPFKTVPKATVEPEDDEFMIEADSAAKRRRLG